MEKWRSGFRKIIVYIMIAVLLSGTAGSYRALPVQAEDMEDVENTAESSHTDDKDNADVIADPESDELEDDTSNDQVYQVSEDEDPTINESDEEIIKISEETVLAAEELPEFPDSDELLMGYIDQTFFADLNNGISMYGNVGADRLTDANEKKIYNELKANIKEIADGKLNSTIIEVTDLSLNRLTWGDSVSKVVSYLMMDCPYDLYWYDKTKTGGVSYSGSGFGDNIIKITFTFKVAKEYQSSDNVTVSSDTADIVHSAVSKANSIVSKYSSESDRSKLENYCQEICSLVDYNHNAANSSSNTPYGNPWQLIWVFDDDSATNVVCEGYSKAFQYLCDLSNFSNGTACYTVIGGIPGGHMWNIVTLEGKNYLVDVTNSDSSSIGQDGSLFLATPTQGTVDTAYTFLNTSGQSITYTYDNTQITLLSKKILCLSAPGEPSYDETTPGTGTNQGPETKPETGTDPKPETGTDPKPETGTDPKPETGTETKPETGTDPKPETGTETKPETSTETKPNTGTGTTSGTGTTTNPQPSTTTKKPTAPASKTVTLSLNSQKLKNNTTLKATFNKKYTFKATVTDKAGKTITGGNAKITWSTSNKKIATVTSSGKVTIKKKAGTVTITAKTADGKTAKVKLKASKAAVKVTKVKITGSKSMNLKKKKTQTLKATVTPASAANQKVTWKSSNKKVATVNSKGKVTAKKAGTVTITATAKDGSKKKATIKIKITKK